MHLFLTQILSKPHTKHKMLILKRKKKNLHLHFRQNMKITNLTRIK